MSEFVRIASISELPDDNAVQEFAVREKTICIANANGEYCALDNACPHQGGPLSMGYVDGNRVVCPWHGWQFDAKTGQLEGGYPCVDVYELRIEDGEVSIKL